MKSLHTLTVQDLLWINLQVTGKVEKYRFADLEEATFYQYAYGQSTNLVGQAARFVSGFAHKAPFANANAETAFLASLAFLEINGWEVTLGDSDGAAWFQKAIAVREGVPSAIEEISHEGHDDHAHEGHDGHGRMPDIKAIVRGLISRYPNTLKALGPVYA